MCAMCPLRSSQQAFASSTIVQQRQSTTFLTLHQPTEGRTVGLYTVRFTLLYLLLWVRPHASGDLERDRTQQRAVDRDVLCCEGPKGLVVGFAFAFHVMRFVVFASFACSAAENDVD